VEPTGQTPRSNWPNQFGLTESHSAPSLSLTLATPMETMSHAPSPACTGRLRPPLALPPLSKRPPPSALPLHRVNRVMVLYCACTHPLWPARVSVPMCSSSPTSSSSLLRQVGLSTLPWWSWPWGWVAPRSCFPSGRGYCHCVLPLHPMLELSSTIGQVSFTSLLSLLLR
jgi:hypothetical protein